MCVYLLRTSILLFTLLKMTHSILILFSNKRHTLCIWIEEKIEQFNMFYGLRQLNNLRYFVANWSICNWKWFSVLFAHKSKTNIACNVSNWLDIHPEWNPIVTMNISMNLSVHTMCNLRMNLDINSLHFPKNHYYPQWPLHAQVIMASNIF